MSSSKCVLLLISFLILIAPASAQPKAGTLKLKPYVFENNKKERDLSKARARLNSLATSG